MDNTEFEMLLKRAMDDPSNFFEIESFGSKFTFTEMYTTKDIIELEKMESDHEKGCKFMYLLLKEPDLTIAQLEELPTKMLENLSEKVMERLGLMDELKKKASVPIKKH